MLFDIKMPKVKRHHSPKSIVQEFTKVEEEDMEDPNAWEGVAEGESFNLVDTITAQGYWGFAVPDQNIIHFWAKKNVSFKTLLFFFGHELGHIADEYLKNWPRTDPFNDEVRADIFAWVASEANKMAKKVSSK